MKLLLSTALLGLTLATQAITSINGDDTTRLSIKSKEQKRLESLENLFPKDRSAAPRQSDETRGMAISEWLVSDDIFRERLALLNNSTPFDLVYNETVKSYIKLYAIDRKLMTARLLGLSNMYFPLFEEVLQKYEMPDELKYLAVIESALHAKAKSHAAAVGLWQFIPSTGKMYGLKINSHLDERSDPIKATHAACRYLKSLYNIFGDWELALAAYNSGPGTVNRAIRQSGGKRNYWEIYDYLPRETRGYVPAFIAVNYAMNYYKEHGIKPVDNEMRYFDFDTIMLNQNANLNQIAAIIDEPVEVLQFLNPALKTSTIPASTYPYALTIPREKMGLFVQNTGKMKSYAAENLANVEVQEEVDTRQLKTYHKVRRGENLQALAKKYNVTVAEIRSWNKMKSTKLALNQKIIVYRPLTVPSKSSLKPTDKLLANKDVKQSTIKIENKKEQAATANTASTKEKEKKSDVEIVRAEKDSKEKERAVSSKMANKQQEKYHVVQKGDTLWSIAKKYEGITVDELKRLNKLEDNKLKLGQKLIVSAG